MGKWSFKASLEYKHCHVLVWEESWNSGWERWFVRGKRCRFAGIAKVVVGNPVVVGAGKCTKVRINSQAGL